MQISLKCLSRFRKEFMKDKIRIKKEKNAWCTDIWGTIEFILNNIEDNLIVPLPNMEMHILTCE